MFIWRGQGLADLASKETRMIVPIYNEATSNTKNKVIM